MLDRVTTDGLYQETVEFEWLALSSIERQLIKLYRQLSDKEQRQMHRFAEILATTQEE
jgi:hypothetical protein